MIKYTKKDKKLFWGGILIGTAGGVFGNLLVSSYFFLFEPFVSKWWIRLLLFLISLAGFIYFFKWIEEKAE